MHIPNKRVHLNISGCSYETLEKTLHRFPETLLGDRDRRNIYFDVRTGVYFFNRSRVAFDAILFYYQSNGCLIRPPFLPMQVFELECIFYQLGQEAIKQMKKREGYDTQKKVYSVTKNKKGIQWLWEFLECPESSLKARIYSFVSLLLIFFSVALDSFETLPELKQHRNNKYNLYDPYNNTKLALYIFFALEFLLRFISSPSKRTFCISVGNIIDALAIFPSFSIYFTEKPLTDTFIFRMFRTIRIFRLVRLSRSFETLSVVLHILSESLSDLFMLIFCMLISCVVFGSMTYYTEIDTPTSPISSIPEGMWFAMQTVVSIGYGDIVPVSVFGKIVASITAVFGALTMTVPLLSLGGRYFAIYTNTFDVSLSANLIRTPSANVKD